MGPPLPPVAPECGHLPLRGPETSKEDRRQNPSRINDLGFLLRLSGTSRGASGPCHIWSISTWKSRPSPCRITLSAEAPSHVSRPFPNLAGKARIDSLRLKSYLRANTLARETAWRRGRAATSAKSQISTKAASSSVGARSTHSRHSRVLRRCRARQKRIAPRGKVRNCLRRQKSDAVGRSPGRTLHDDPSDASNRLPGLALQRNALRR